MQSMHNNTEVRRGNWAKEEEGLSAAIPGSFTRYDGMVAKRLIRVSIESSCSCIDSITSADTDT